MVKLGDGLWFRRPFRSLSGFFVTFCRPFCPDKKLRDLHVHSIGGWTSIDPSYFGLHQGIKWWMYMVYTSKGFWPPDYGNDCFSQWFLWRLSQKGNIFLEGQLLPVQDADPPRLEARKWWGPLQVYDVFGGPHYNGKKLLLRCKNPFPENLLSMRSSLLGGPKHLPTQTRNSTGWDPRRPRRVGFTLIKLEGEKSKMPGGLGVWDL